MDTLKLVHVSAVYLSGTGFVLRGIWMLMDSPLLKARLTRILPHIIDTVLLGSAILLALRNPADPAQPQIGEEIAAARALSDLVHQLLDKAAAEIEDVTHKPAHLTG